MHQLWLVSLNDFKLVFREPSMRIFLLMPGLILIVLLVLVPYLQQLFAGIDPYIPLILMAACLQTSTMFGFIYSMILIDEKDTQVAKVYGVLPVVQEHFLFGRLVFPLVITGVITWGILLVQPFYQNIAWVAGLLVSLLAAVVALHIAIVVAILGRTKMEGLTWFKVINLLVVLPLFAFFLPHSYRHFFGLIPTHWVYQSLDRMINGESYWIFLSIGFGLSGILLWILIRKFSKIHFL